MGAARNAFVLASMATSRHACAAAHGTSGGTGGAVHVSGHAHTILRMAHLSSPEDFGPWLEATPVLWSLRYKPLVGDALLDELARSHNTSAQPTWVCWHAALAGMMYTMAWIRTGWHRSSRAVIDAGPPRPGMRQSCRHCLNKRAACGWGGSQSVVACATCRSHGTCGDPSGRRSCPSTSVKSTRCWMPSSRGKRAVARGMASAADPVLAKSCRRLPAQAVALAGERAAWRAAGRLQPVVLRWNRRCLVGPGKGGRSLDIRPDGALLGLLLAVMGVLWVPVRWALRQLTLDLTHRRAGLLLALPAPLMAIGSLVLVHGLGHRMEGTLLIFMALPLATARLWRRVGARMRFESATACSWYLPC